MRTGSCGIHAAVKTRIGGILLLLIVLPHCGYKFIGATRGLVGVEKVAIETPRNDSYQPGIEVLVADALRRELLRRGGVELVEDPADADLVVSGTVQPLNNRPRTFSSVVLVYEYEVTMTVDLTARRGDGEELLVGGDELSESERYLSSADVEAQRKNQQEALRRVARLVAARFFDSLVEAINP
jgi:hypothetical protein